MTTFMLGPSIGHLAHCNVILFSTDWLSSIFACHHTRYQGKTNWPQTVLGMVMHACDLSTQKVESGWTGIQSHPLGYIVNSRTAWATWDHVINKAKPLTSRKSQSREENKCRVDAPHHCGKWGSKAQGGHSMKVDALLWSKANGKRKGLSHAMTMCATVCFVLSFVRVGPCLPLLSITSPHKFTVMRLERVEVYF